MTQTVKNLINWNMHSKYWCVLNSFYTFQNELNSKIKTIKRDIKNRIRSLHVLVKLPIDFHRM